ncbi:MAG: hypothetical protein FJ098_08565 [Deltaproteobacteria bacterium]|nr:hypothetical protein [Deltaproteobacteria bacterium]
MRPRWCSILLAAGVLAGCSAAGTSGEEKAALETKLQGLQAENAKLSGQLGDLSEKAFDRASRAEKQRGLGTGSHVLGSARDVVIGPLKFKRRAASFDLDVSGGAQGALEAVRAVLRPRGGGTVKDADHHPDPDKGKAGHKGKSKNKKKGKKHKGKGGKR